MARLREISRTAAFAWSNSIVRPTLAVGTRAGAVDSDFSTETKLELWDLDLGNTDSGAESSALASIPTDARFYDLAWSEPSKDHPEGVIAGALENGALNLWDAAKLKANASDALISSTTKHTGAIKALQFNPHRPELLASAGDKGELYITDLNKPSDPYRIGTAAARSDNFDCLDWNKKVPHILVTGSSAGFVTVWDIKAKKESLTLNNHGRKPVSAVAWNPDVPTKLATAIPTDQDPLILTWDLRNSSAPERILKGHDQGVLSLAWCGQDSDLLLSCGKDNRSLCWNPHTAQLVGEFPIVTNWTFQTRWHPKHPSLCATASFDGKIVVQTIQNTKTSAPDATTTSQAADGADFFAKAQTQPQGSTFSLPKPPKWMRRPVGASFGFGGKLVTFTTPEEQGAKSTVKISTFVADEGVESSISDFEKALDDNDSTAVIDSRIESADSEASKEDWKVIQALTTAAPRKALLSHLGFEEKKAETTAAAESAAEADKGAQTNGEATTKDTNRLSSFFDNAGDGQGFLADLAASKGAKTNNPFHIYKGAESDTDKDITRALLLGKFEDAVDLCLKEKRISDAFMVAVCGGQSCIDKVQAAYFAQQSDGPNYLRLLASVVGKNLWDVVYNADLANWKEVMAALCTYADQTEFPDLCEALGDRLEEQTASRKDAAFCYLAGSKLDKVVPIWVADMQKQEKESTASSGDESEFSIHVRSLQAFIEKVSIFRSATKYEDKDGREKGADWKLEPLYQRYSEYADVVAGQGHLNLAQKFLDFLPAKYPTAEVARNRIKQAGRKAGAQRGQPSSVSAAANNPFQPIVAPSNTTRQPASAYAPSNAYAPAGFQPQQQTPPAASPYGAPAGAYGGYQAPAQQSFAPPPQAGMSSPPPPGGPPPPANKNANTTSWNDLPDNFVPKPASRRGTPAAAPPVGSPYGGQPPNPYGSSFQPPPSQPAKATTPLPPPPKAGQAPPRVGSPLVDRSMPDPTQRPSSAAANAYAPQAGPPPSSGAMAPPVAPPARGASPYQPPPSQASGPPSNRYAPAPGSGASPAPPGGYGAPGARQVAPNPYSTAQGNPAQSQYGAPPPQQTRPPTGPPPMAAGPPPSGPPRGTTPGQAAAPPPPPAAASAANTYPAGDRSHLSPAALPIYEFLNAEVQRILAKAPAQYRPRVEDSQKRLNILFDQLNNGVVSDPSIVQSLDGIVQAMRTRDFDKAQSVFGELNKQPELGGSKWMVGIKYLIPMSRATPPS